MKYLQSSFSMQPPEKLDGLGCPRCALGPKWGEHTEDCLNGPVIEADREYTAELRAALKSKEHAEDGRDDLDRLREALGLFSEMDRERERRRIL